MPQSSAMLARKRNALLGALVADAAAMGVHWLYDPAHLEKMRVAKADGREDIGLEFSEPAAVAADFKDRGYFAHGHKRAGDNTQKGAHLRSAIDTLGADHGKWNDETFIKSFHGWFGPGGKWVGYLDGNMLATMDNIKENERTVAAAAAVTAGLTGAAATTVAKLLPKKHAGGNDAKALGEAVCEASEKAATAEQAKTAAENYLAHLGDAKSGADDAQSGAICNVPCVVIANIGQADLGKKVEASVRLTNNNDDAVNYSLFFAKVLERVLQGEAVPAALQASVTVLDGARKENTMKGLTPAAAKMDAPALAAAFQMPCALEYGIPLCCAILNREPSFATAARLNLMAGGDSAGRALILGSILGAARGVGVADGGGVPLSWLGQMNGLDSITADIEKAVPASGAHADPTK